MNFNPDLLVPWGYGDTYRTLAEVEAILRGQDYHPNYLRVLLPWLSFKGGDIGVGGTRRELGQQPNRDGFAPEGDSFHQPQRYVDNWFGPSAIDVVAKDGPDAGSSHDSVRWDQVPRQGSAEAALRGVHANVGTEAWHIQGIKIDGHLSWVKAGRPVPVEAHFPIPGVNPAPAPEPVGKTYTVRPGDGWLTIAKALGVPMADLDRTASIIRSGKIVRSAPVGTFVVWPGDIVAITKPVDATFRNTAPPSPTLRWGDVGDRVRQLQVVLRIQVDGHFGPATDRAVKDVQGNLGGLTVDGIYGPATDAALRRYLKSVGLPS